MIVPSIIAEDAKTYKAYIERLCPVSQKVHLDVMDGVFVASSSLDWQIENPSGEWEVHLMVHEALGRMERYEQAKMVYVHAESVDAQQAIMHRKDQGKPVGLALKPSTDLLDVFELISLVDAVLILTVEPGAYGSDFLPDPLKKIPAIKQGFPAMVVEVDGGMTPQTISQARDAGADDVVCGSFINEAQDAVTAMTMLHAAFSKRGE